MALFFHAQQAVEKSLKAVLFSRQIEFKRTHNLTNLAHLLRQDGVEMPITDDALHRLNPFAVTFRYDDMEIESVTRDDAMRWATDARRWAEAKVRAAAESDESAPDL